MPPTRRTFRIFVSSTFSDLTDERNALQERVFPRLRELCRQHGARFQAIDLRWGVSEEAAIDQQTMKICLGEIERCRKITPRPNFIVLLGDRYGWLPPPPEIPAAEFDALLGQVHDPQDQALLRRWYRLDQNAVPAEYCLLPREGDMVAYAHWEMTERRLQRTLEAAARRLALPPAAMLKYAASATEQEIVAGALGVPDAERHVFCFLREIDGLPRDIRAKGLLDLDLEGSADTVAAQKLAALKSRLEARMPRNTFRYKASWQGKGISLTHLDRLCEDVYGCLSQMILREVAALQRVDPLEKEIESHQAFGRDRARLFVGRADLLKRTLAYLSSSDPHPFAIWGQSGTGKSALLARAIELARQQNPRAQVVCRFIGATPESSNCRALLEGLCREISRIVGAAEATVPAGFAELVRDLPARLALLPPGKQLILFLDALDQLAEDDDARGLAWLPAALPSGVHLVVSTLPGNCKQALEKKLPRESLGELLPMPAQEGEQLLDALLADAGRTLQPQQRRPLLERFAANRLPLFLKLAFEEARRWKSYGDAARTGADMRGIIQGMFARLSAPANHGEVLVSRTLGYLAAARNGLTEDEVLDLLSLDQAVYGDFVSRAYHKPPEQRLPVVVWSRLLLDLEPYLVERSADGTTTIDFYHQQLREAATAQHLSGSSRAERHRALAAYFAAQPLRFAQDQAEPGTQREEGPANLRKLSELPYQLARAGQWPQYAATLMNLEFLQAKVEAVGPAALVADYDLYPAEPQQQGADELRLVQDTLRLSTQVLAGDPTQLSGQLLGHLLGSDSHLIAPLIEKATRWRGATWLRPLSPSLTQPGGPLLRTLQSHKAPVDTVVMTPDGRIGISGDTDGRLIVWDLRQGTQLHSLTGHQAYVPVVAVTPDGKRAVSGGYDKTVRVWDLERGTCLHVLKGHPVSLFSIAITADGRRAASADRKSVHIWDLERGVELGQSGHKGNGFDITLDEETGTAFLQSGKEILRFDLATGKKLPPRRVKKAKAYFRAITRDGLWAFSPRSETVDVWDVSAGSKIAELEGHQAYIQGLSATPDGRWLATASSDETVRVWDITAAAESRMLKHPDQVRCVYMTPDGQYVISGAQDHTVRVWDTRRTEGKARIVVHADGVSDVAVSPDGRVAASAGGDAIHLWDIRTARRLRSISAPGVRFSKLAFTGNDRILAGEWSDESSDLTLWDTTTGRGAGRMRGHRAGIWALAASPDGRYVLSGSRDLTFRFWDLARGVERWQQHGREGLHDEVMAAAFLPDGQGVLVGLYDGSLHLWDTSGQQQARGWGGHQMDKQELARHPELATFGRQTRALLGGLAITPDGRYAVTASADRTAAVWQIATGRRAALFRGHGGAVRDVAVNSEGTLAVSASDDHSVQVWKVGNGERVATFTGDGSFTTCAFAPDGCHIVAGDSAGRVHFFRLEAAQP